MEYGEEPSPWTFGHLLCWLGLHAWEGGGQLLYDSDWATRVWIIRQRCERYYCQAHRDVPSRISDIEARKQLGL